MKTKKQSYQLIAGLTGQINGNKAKKSARRRIFSGRFTDLTLFDLSALSVSIQTQIVKYDVWTRGELDPHAQLLRSNAKPLRALTHRTSTIAIKN